MLKVGIAGYGIVGKRRKRYIDQHPDMQTVAVCDRDFGANGVLENGIKCYKDYKSLLKLASIDVLFVCMPNDIAPEVTISALRKGLHVFCEKPPGRNLSDIAEVIQVEKENPTLKLKYGFNHRYHDSVIDALKVLDSNEFGEVINMRAVYGKSSIVDPTKSDSLNWRASRAIAGGGILLDQGVHMVDLLRLFAGEFVEISSFISNDFWKHDVEDNAYALMKTADNKVAMLHSSATQWRHRFELDITFKQGSVILGGILSSTKSYGAETLKKVWAGKDGLGDPIEQTTLYNRDNSWEYEVNDFADVILNDKAVTSGSSYDAFKTMELVCKIYCADSEWKNKWSLTDSISKTVEEVI